MCSVQEDEATGLLTKCKLQDNIPKKCMKCDEKPVVVIRINDAFCRECFRHYCVHKFRSTFGRTHIVKHKERVLLAYSGGHGASALLHLVMDGLSERTHKKIGFVPGVLFIDEGATLTQNIDERLAVVADVSAVMKSSGFPFYLVSLETALDLPDGSRIYDNMPQDKLVELSRSVADLSMNEENTTLLRNKLDAFKTLSAKLEFINVLRQRLIVSMAKKYGYSKIMTGDTATKLSVSILSNIAQGKGAHISLDTGFTDTRDNEVMILRPMREFNAKEVCMYNSFFGLNVVTVPNLTTKVPHNSSIYQLTESFVAGLQADFPSTVPTVFRTGSKMQLTVNHPQQIQEGCAFCQAPLDTDVCEASALNATQLSMKLSRKTSGNVCVDTDSCCGEGDGSCHTRQQSRFNVEDVVNCLCYGCRLVFRDLDDVNQLPLYLINEISKRNRRAKMRGEICEFLLEDDGS